MESVHEAFQEIGDTLANVAEKSHAEEPGKAIVKTYLRLEYCNHAERGCPLTTLAPELARIEKRMRSQIFAELLNYKDRMTPFMPGKRTAEKERAFFVIFSTMVGAIEIARMLPERSAQEMVLASARDFLLHSF
jgi:TetR/AcrR family transcriptional repressor of nem operon